MSNKLESVFEYVIQTTAQFSNAQGSWQNYLRTSANVYKYPFRDQILIHAQNPHATACASIDFWNNRMGRWINKGAHGIALLDDSGTYTRLKYVFDVADTHSRYPNSIAPNIWEMQPQHEQAIINALSKKFDISNLPNASFFNQICSISQIIVRENLVDYLHELDSVKSDSLLEKLDPLNLKIGLQILLANSIAYTVSTRCGLDADAYFKNSDFEYIADYSTYNTISVLGNITSTLSKSVLLEIGRTITQQNKIQVADKQPQPLHDNNIHHESNPDRKERQNHESETDLYPKRRLSVSESDPTRITRDDSTRQIWDDAQNISEATPPHDLRPSITGRSTRQLFDTHQSAGNRNGGQPNSKNGRDSRNNRANESSQSNVLGSNDEQLPSISRRNRSQSTDLQLSFLAPEGAIEAENVADTSSAFSFVQSDIDQLLRYGGNTDRQRECVAAEFSKQRSVEENAAYLQSAFHGGNGIITENGSITAWYAEDGIHLSRTKSARYDNAAQVISWESAAERISQLLEEGSFATNVELIEAAGYERSRLAEKLLYLYRDLSADARKDFLLSLNENPAAGFPDEMAWISQRLSDPAFRAKLSEEYEGFLEAYGMNREILRFHYHRTKEIAADLADLELPRNTFETNMAELPNAKSYITEDEIDAALARGSSFAGGKSRIYPFFLQEHTTKEKADFLRQEYGTFGGHSDALSGSSESWEEHDSRGKRFRKEGCPDVILTWEKVASRITDLIYKDRYLTTEEQQAYERTQAEKNLAEAETDDLQTDAAELKDRLAASGIVNGQVVDMEKLDNDPFIQQVMHDAEQIAAENVETVPEESAQEQVQIQNTFHSTTKYIDHFYVVEDLQVQGALALKEYSTFDDAMRAYQRLSTDKVKALGVEKVSNPFPGALDLIQCIDGQDKIIQDYTKVDGWENPEILEVVQKIKTAIQAKEISADTQQPENFHITDTRLGEGGAKAKFDMNLQAIQLLKTLEDADRQATSDQQQVLSRYVGWGGLADAFDPDKPAWSKEYQELKKELTPAEYEAARASTLNAHYTSPTVIKAIYEAVGDMGFETGKILEPSCGVGNFFGMLPEEMQSSRLYGVELDSISGRIAKQLYPKADIKVVGFETTNRRDFFDLAIGNIPFGNYKVADKPYDKLGFSIHNYFFAKSIDQVRPGGVIAFVTSRFTMDSQNPEARKYIAQRAELLGAIRLPNDAFKKNAGTEVVSDIIFLQKREQEIDTVPEWVHLSTTPDGYTMNSYFVDHPEMILGELSRESTQYGKDDLTVRPIEGAELSAQLKEAVQHIGGTYQAMVLIDLLEEPDNTHREKEIPADPAVKNYSYTVIDGAIYYRENDQMIRQEVNPTAKERIKGMIKLRDCTRQLIAYQIEDYSEQAIKESQQQLNQLYDAFVKQYGRIGSRANNSAFRSDNSYYLLMSLEVTDSERNFVRKADMFTKRTIKQKHIVTSVDTASEALIVSLAEKARIDIPYMTELTGKNAETLVSELRDVIFRLPSSKDDEAVYVTADEYLSGNVREKLREAKQAADTDKSYQQNVSALEAVQPVDLTPGEISVRLGSTWIPPKDIANFMYELFDTPKSARWNIKVHYSKVTATWNIEGKSNDRSSIKACSTYGTSRINGYKIIEDTLNLKDVRIFDYVEDENGNKVQVLNKKETAIAQSKQEMIKQAFTDWIWKDAERRERLCTQYNEQYNAIRPRQYDGSHLNFVGMNPEITLRPHQLNAIAHIIYGGNTLLAHVVGAGKTFEVVAAAQESKRLGLCQKSMIAVPNHLTEQWASEYLQLYPSANILVVTKKDFEPQNRKKFCARIAASDVDAVIIGHSQLEKIPMSIERQKRSLEEQLEEVMDGIADLKANEGERFSIKQLERTRKSLEVKLTQLNDQSRKDDVVTFEELGVDRLFVDEAHSFKNLAAYTKMRNVAGISQTEAQKSSDLYMKCRYLDELTGCRGVIFATGTPISNSMVEMYTMQKYLQHNALKEKELLHFDSWASTFGETVTAIELAPEGTGYRAKTRFAKFHNLPELMSMFKEVADIQTADMLQLPVPKANYHSIVLKPSEQQKAMVASLSERAERVRNKMVDSSVDNMLVITNDGRKLALDQRLINPMLPDSEGGKVSACAENVFDIWQRTAEQRSTQMVFCDLSTPKNHDSFNVYDDLRDKLIEKGIPENEIAYIHNANAEAQKKELFGKVNTGEVRILLGSTQKMGAGTNCQKLLIALHHLDCPWRPADLQQREGRIIRQGNENKEVHIYTYVTENTFDSYLYQLVESKQKFIGQIMTSKAPVRSAEDIDETALSYAEIKALCTGNPHIKEKMDLDIAVQQLRLLKSNYLNQKYSLEDKISKTYPKNIAALEQRITGYQDDITHLAGNTHPNANGFSPMQIKGVVYQEKKDAGNALISACQKMTSPESVPLGQYRGFELSISFDSWKKEYILAMKHNLQHSVRLGTDIYGNIQRIDNALNSLSSCLEDCKNEMSELKNQFAIAQVEVQKPFAQEDELAIKSARLAELDALLNMDEKDSDSGEKVAKPRKKTPDLER